MCFVNSFEDLVCLKDLLVQFSACANIQTATVVILIVYDKQEAHIVVNGSSALVLSLSVSICGSNIVGQCLSRQGR